MNLRVKELTGGLLPDVNSECCASRGVLEHVTSRWAVLVLAVLLDGTHRFSELRRAVGGVSEKMLAQTLQTLEQDGLVLREAYAVIPPRVDYSLTPLGEEAAQHVWTLARWAESRVPEVLAARAAHAEQAAQTAQTQQASQAGRAPQAGRPGRTKSAR
ncbi:winged helix-turn-helix transcriptional regulator [Kitasatospora cineracea]|uniref:HxlR family transcriptional regulator n=1 Tax=Kitasatospora cineracea TaxID=88074 RepID=A0A3N4RLI4_9ACTN|nr:helix-turn-helix domain-containing protein [Kitasatospora cineracea]RPE27820.1 HxlR family transcriptional regulator [Kitasatospora cineracea]